MHNSISLERSRALAASCMITARRNRSCHQVVRRSMGCPRARSKSPVKSGARGCIRTISRRWTPLFAARSLMAKESLSWNFAYSATVRCGGSSRVSSSHTTTPVSPCEGPEHRSTLLSANRQNGRWPNATYSLVWRQRLAALVATRMTPTRRSCRFLPAMRPFTALLKALSR